MKIASTGIFVGRVVQAQFCGLPLYNDLIKLSQPPVIFKRNTLYRFFASLENDKRVFRSEGSAVGYS